MKFRINYATADITHKASGAVIHKAGDIVSYSEGDDDEQHECPQDCATLTYAYVVPQLFDTNFNIVMKVDLGTKELVFINPVVIPKPIQSDE